MHGNNQFLKGKKKKKKFGRDFLRCPKSYFYLEEKKMKEEF